MRRRNRKLTDDDLAVWRQVADTAKPLSAPHVQPLRRPVAPAQQADALPLPEPIRKVLAEPFVRLNLAPDPMAGLIDAPMRTDKRTHRRLQRGKLDPDATIDLHGMTAARAHAVLTAFVAGAHGRGHRLILVITGKGRDPDPATGALGSHRGVLRAAVPHWLALPPLAPLVLQILPAHARHGGGGAYYVYLRRAR